MLKFFFGMIILGLATVASAESSGARGKSTLGLGGMYAGVSDFVLESGGSLQVQLSSSSQIGVGVLSGSLSLADAITTSSSTLEITKAEISGYGGFLFWRYFTGNSFNIIVGAGQRKAEINYRIEDNTSFYLEGQLELSSTVGVFSIGNQWQWDSGVYFGIDWLLVMTPLMSEVTAETTGTLDNASVTSLNQQFLDLGNELSEINSFTLGLTSIGFMF